MTEFTWVRKPLSCSVSEKEARIVTQPFTDLWQRTYYGFRNDSAPILLFATEEKYFSFTVKTRFDSGHRFDQCGIAVYLDSENWLKASAEYENDEIQKLGSVVTNHGYSDWATSDMDASVKCIWYRLSRRESDYRIEYSLDGTVFKQMRICRLPEGGGNIRFGIYACSPEDSSFEAVFTDAEITECVWAEHR